MSYEAASSAIDGHRGMKTETSSAADVERSRRKAALMRGVRAWQELLDRQKSETESHAYVPLPHPVPVPE